MPGVGRGPPGPAGRADAGRGAPGRGAPGRGAPGRGPPEPAAGRGPPAPAAAGRSVFSSRRPGRGIPWDGANGLLPGRGAPVPRSFSPRPRGRGMPCEGANGLLPGRAAGRGAPGRGALLRVPVSAEAAGFSASGALGAGRAPGLAPDVGAAAGFCAAGAGASGAEAGAAGAGAAGAGAAEAAGAGAAGAGAAGADAAGVGAAGAGAAGAADGRGPGVPADAAGLESDFDSDAGKAPRSFLTTGASIVDEAERTNSPSSCSFATASFEVMPSSLASSCTRTLATFLLSRSAPSQVRTVYFLRASTAVAAKPITEHKVLIAGYSSGFHQIADPLPGWTVSSPLPVGACSRALNQASASAVSIGPLKARLNARRRSAAAKHAVPRCTQAPRPDMRRFSSTRTAVLPSVFTATSRISTAWSSVFLHPMHVLCGTCAAAPEAAGDKKKADGDPALSILTRFSPCAASTRRPACLGGLRVGNDVDAPARQLGCQAGVLPFLADCQRKLVVGNHNLR